MKNTFFAAIAALVVTTTPVMANDFSGPRIEATTGYRDVTRNRTNLTYGAEAGYDINVLGPIRVGVEIGVDNIFDRRAINTGARVGIKLASNIFGYAKIGYSNYRAITFNNLDGAKFGGGVEAKLIGPMYTKIEYSHSDFGGTKIDDAIAGVGIRF
jgi:opacity protein-like surface antigen